MLSIVELANEGIDTILITANLNLNDYANIENATLGTLNGGGDFAVYGTAAVNVINGNAGANVIYGFGDNDTLNGDGGNDTLLGGDGNDVINGGAGADIIYGEAGADILAGGTDNDQYYGVDDADTITELAGGGYDAVFAVGNITLGANSEVELIAAGAATLNVQGSSTSNYIVGNALGNSFQGLGGNDILVGNGGVDVLQGGDGDDYVYGGDDGDYIYAGNGSDLIFGDGGNDFLYGNDGNDFFYLADSGDTIVELLGEGYDVVYPIANIVLGTDANIELIVLIGPVTSVTGSSVSNYFAGNAESTMFSGLGGDDTIVAGGGDDILLGGLGADNLYGEDGNDILEGGAGIDYLSGGAGADIFRFSDISSFDLLVDFQSGVDQIALSNAAFSHTATLSFVSGAGAQSATNGNSTFLYDTSNGQISYDPDGNGAAAAIVLAYVAQGTIINASDFVFY